MTKTRRMLSLRHVIVTFGTCLNCQSLSAVKVKWFWMRGELYGWLQSVQSISLFMFNHMELLLVECVISVYFNTIVRIISESRILFYCIIFEVAHGHL